MSDVNVSAQKFNIKLFVPEADGMTELWLRLESVCFATLSIYICTCTHCAVIENHIVFEDWAIWLGLRQGIFTCVGWQVTLSDPIWQVMLCSSAMVVLCKPVHNFF